MIDDIEDGKINCVVTKDLSRLGRNYILTGQYTEIYFPSKGVRYIAINDNVDTINGESELAPFLNILNEMHARPAKRSRLPCTQDLPMAHTMEPMHRWAM